MRNQSHRYRSNTNKKENIVAFDGKDRNDVRKVPLMRDNAQSTNFNDSFARLRKIIYSTPFPAAIQIAKWDLRARVGS